MNWPGFGILVAADTGKTNKAILVYAAPVNESETRIQKKVKASGVVETTIEFINETFVLASPLTFKIGGRDGPLYDGDINQIIVPCSFIQEVEQRFWDVDYSQTGVSHEEATMDALMHTLFQTKK